MNKLLTTTAIALAFAAIAGHADAGRIVLTGHDNDFHYDGGFSSNNELAATDAELTYILNGQGSSKGILVIDDQSEASELITAASAAVGGGAVTTKSVGAITAADFDFSKYSAFVVASDTECGGCDNPVGTGTTLAAFSSAIDAFYTAGGGILGLTSSTDPHGFDYVPDVAVSTPISGSSGFTATALGIANMPGFQAVNGDETHNIFASGTSSAYLVAEVGPGNEAVTIFTDAVITCVGDACGFTPSVPEPVSLSLFGAALAGLGIVRRRKKTV